MKLNTDTLIENNAALFTIFMAMDGHDPFGDPSKDGVSEGDWEFAYVTEAEDCYLIAKADGVATFDKAWKRAMVEARREVLASF
jgi:hypothetical protein